MLALIRKSGIGIVIIVVFFLGLKESIRTVWKSPQTAQTYSVVGDNDSMLMLAFLPKNEVIMMYATDNGRNIEANLSVMRGVYGTNYFWRLWRLDGPGSYGGWFGLRVFPEGFKPVIMESEVQKKFVHGTLEPVFPKPGETTYPLLVFSEDELEFQGMRLQLGETDPSFLETLREKLK